MSSPTRTINLYYLFTFIRGLRFFFPIWTLYLNSIGYDIFIITLLDIIFFVTIAVAEIPTGTVADKISRKLSLLIGVLLYSIGIITFAFANNLWVLAAGYIIWATGMTFWSGADQAFLYDSLKFHSKEEEFQRIFGQTIFLESLAMAFASIIGGLIGSFDLQMPFLLTVVMCIASGVIMLFIPEEIPMDGISKETYSSHIRKTIGLVKNNRVLVLLFTFSLIFAIMGIIEFVFRQLYLREELDISVFIIGLLYAMTILLGGLGAKSSSHFNEVLGDKLFLWIQVGIIGLSFFTFSIAIQWVIIPFLLLYSYFGSAFGPFFTRLVNDEIPSEKRATVFSLVGVLITGSVFVFEIVAGYLASQTSISFVYFILSSCFFIVCIIPLILWTRMPLHGDKTQEISSSQESGDYYP
jgi:MFS family permease